MSPTEKSRFKLLFEVANDLGLEIVELPDGTVAILTELSNKQINRLGW